MAQRCVVASMGVRRSHARLADDLQPVDAADRHNGRTGRGVVFAIDYHEHIVGQISLGAINLGSMRTGVIGYSVDQQYAGHGFAPMAVALLADWAFCDPTTVGCAAWKSHYCRKTSAPAGWRVKWGVIMGVPQVHVRQRAVARS